ncbi:MAG: hypothetical protein MZW92_81940 [Comamonadaceae bacterium]|nr:hypothetical protein [Comamonadaceae bacterium]
MRRGRKVVQETVAQLGELDAEGRARATLLARELTGRGEERRQGSLFDAPQPEEAVKVRLDAVRLERSRGFGAVWLGWLLWRALKLDELLDRLMPAGRETVRWAEVIAILAIGRLCEPSSELHVAERWYRTTALEDLLEVPTETIYDERLYRSLDRVLPHKTAIEAHLVERLRGVVRAGLRPAALRRDEHVLRGRGGRSRVMQARLLARSPSRLRAGEHRAGGDARRHAARLRDLPGQHGRREHGRGDRRARWRRASATRTGCG